jgi:hypothetical protein
MKKLFLIIILIFGLQTSVYAADARSYIIIGDEHRVSDVYICDSYYIFVPDNLDNKKQLITKDMLKEDFEKVPLKLRSGIQCLILLDYKSPWEAEFKKMYDKDISIFSQYYQNNIFFFQNDNFETSLVSYQDGDKAIVFEMLTVKNCLKKYVYHESAHHYDSINKTSESAEWKGIIDVDKVKLHQAETSNYAEEFAESVDLYYNDPDRLKKNCPKRYEFISKLLE